MSLREELIQVAAVAVAIVEDLDFGQARREAIGTWDEDMTTASVLREVDAERARQDEKWGPQHHDPATWLAILSEEVGEAGAEVDWGPLGASNKYLLGVNLESLERRARVYLRGKFGAITNA